MPRKVEVKNGPENVQFIEVENTLKDKVGTGGLSEDILNKAQALIENTAIDFKPMAEIYLQALQNALELSRTMGDDLDHEGLIKRMLNATMQLKANGGMFGFPLVTRISEKLVNFFEVIHHMNADSHEIIQAFMTTIRIVLIGDIRGDGGAKGVELMNALDNACARFLEKYPRNRGSRLS
ncbi:MAG: hypothetical protein GC136_09885 [Alphaproteobacteria bacterium]|nr:hypothetical protein [Alphaproteobacteria bacterium]